MKIYNNLYLDSNSIKQFLSSIQNISLKKTIIIFIAKVNIPK